jgi:general stress protein 26
MDFRMKTISGLRPHFLLVAAMLAAAVSTPCQSASTPAADKADARRQELLSAARETMQTARYCAVITVDETGWAQSRTVDAFAPESNMVVWFATNPKTRKVTQIKRDPRVTLYYFSTEHPELGYVTLLGRARLVDDAAEKQRRWKPEWAALWPDRNASYLLVEITPERLELMSPKHGITGDPITWAPASLEFGASAQRPR